MPGLLESFILTVLTSAGLSGTALGIGVSAITGIVGIGLSVGLNFLASSLFKPSAPKPEDVQQSTRQPTPPRFRHYGRVKVSGAWAFGEAKHGNFYKVLALGQGPFDAIEEYWVDDNHVTVEPDFGVDDEPYNGKVRIETRLGTPSQSHYANLTAVFPEWTVDHVGKGIATLFITQRATASKNYLEKFPNGINTSYRVVARTSQVYDVRTGVTAWSDNAALIIRDYMVHPDGMRFPAAMLETPLALAGWQAMASRADELIPLKAGGTEKRYRLWGSYKLEERPADVLGRFLASSDARLTPTPDGGLAIDIGAWEEPNVVIDESIITGFTDLSRGRDILSTANTIRATFLDPTQDYQAADADAWVDEDDVEVRGEIATDLQLQMSPSHGQARRLMKIASYRANPQWVGQFTCNLKALAAFGKRLVRIKYPLFNINEVFELQDFRFIMGEGGILQGVSIQVQSLPAAAYSWDAATEEGTAPISEEIVVDKTIPIPQGFTFTEGTVTVGGDPFSVGVIAFDQPPSDALKVQGQYKKVSDVEWNVIPIADDATAAQTSILDDGVQYEAQVRHVTITGRVGEWSTPTLKMTPLSDPVAPKPLVSFTLAGSAPYLGNAQFSLTTQNDDHLRHVALYRVPAGGTLNRITHLVVRIPVTTAGSTYAYTDGDSTVANLITNGNFAADANWSKGVGWTIAAGVASHAAGSASNLIQTGLAAMTAVPYRLGFTISALTAGSLQPFTTPPTTTGPSFNSNGTKLATFTPGTGATQFGFTTTSTLAASIDNVYFYQETAACAPQGVWDYYVEPLNPSGVAGALIGPRTVTVV